MASCYLKCIFCIHLLEEHRTLSKTSHDDADCDIIIRKLLYSINVLLAFICHWDIKMVDILVDTIFCCRFRLLYKLPWGISKMDGASLVTATITVERKFTRSSHTHTNNPAISSMITYSRWSFMFLSWHNIHIQICYWYHAATQSILLSVLTKSTITLSRKALYL
jgi:hypothetical protein